MPDMTLFKQHLYKMKPYEPPLEGRSASEHLLLDFNERTLPVSDSIVQALTDYVQSGCLQKYPSYEGVVDKLAGYTGAASDQIMITNGSDQGIDLVTRAVLGVGDQAIIPEPTFAMYRQAAEVECAEILTPRYDIEVGYPVDEVLSLITPKTRLIVIPLPNNPTGTSVSEANVEKILKAAPLAVVLVDECYYEYSGHSVVGLINGYSNLVIARTFSKTWGMPSLRFGFLLSQADNIRQLLKIRGPYDVNQMAIVAVNAALASPEYTQEYVKEVMTESKPMLERWLKEKQIAFWPSTANYVWMFPAKAKELERFLQENAILVRPKYNDQNELGLRVTLGSRAQTEKFIGMLEHFYK